MRYYATTRVAVMWAVSATSKEAVWRKLSRLFFISIDKLQEMGFEVVEDKIYG